MAACPYVGDYFTSLMLSGRHWQPLQRPRGTGRGRVLTSPMYEVLLRIGSSIWSTISMEYPPYPRPGAPPEPVRHRRDKCEDGFIGCASTGEAEQVPSGAEIGRRPLGDGGISGGHQRAVAQWPIGGSDRAKLDDSASPRGRDLEKEFSDVGIAANAVLEFDQVVARSTWLVARRSWKVANLGRRPGQGRGIFRSSEQPGASGARCKSRDGHNVVLAEAGTPVKRSRAWEVAVIKSSQAPSGAAADSTPAKA